MNEATSKLTPLLFIAPITVLSYYFSHFQPMPAYHIAIAGFLVLWSLISARDASIAFLIMMIIIDDYPRLYSDYMLSLMPFSSLYSITFSGMTLYLIMAIYFIVLNVYSFVDDDRKNPGIYLKFYGSPPEIKIILVIGALSALVGLLNITHAARLYISDAGFFINIILGHLIIRNSHWRPGYLYNIYILIISAMISKILMVVLDAMFFSRSFNLVTVKPGTDSYLAILVILFGVAIMMRKGAEAIWLKYFSAIMIVITISYYFLTAARGRMAIGVIAFLIFLLQIRTGRGVALLVAMAAAIWGAQFLVPTEYMSYFAWKSGSFVASQGEGTSSLVRVISLKNIIFQQLETVYQMFTGTGFGGYFTTKYYPFPMNLSGGDAFPDEWIAADTFYKPHGSTLILLLKTGMVGFVLIYATFISRTIYNIKLSREVVGGNKELSKLMIILLTISPCILPFMVINFSSKLQLLTGALIGLSYYSGQFIKLEETMLRKNDYHLG